MTAHVSEELPLLLTGEADRATVLAAAAHLRGCVDCQHELVSAVVAHSSLTSARRFAPDMLAAGSDAAPATPAAGSDAAPATPAAGSDAAPATPTAGSDAAPATPAGLPDLSELFAQARREAAEPHGRRRVRLVAAAAAAVVLAGGGTATYLAVRGGAPAARTVHLAAFGAGHTSASATVAGNGTIRIDAASLPELTGQRYEVWLTNAQRTRMQPIGWLSHSGTATMTVPQDLLARFTDVEVSVQRVAAPDYTYSGTSVLRGALG